MREFSEAEKGEIFESVKRQVDQLIEENDNGGEKLHHEGACFYYAVFTVLELKKRGVMVGLQAGSASWARIRPEQDDGVMMTHFSYQWSPHEPQSQVAMLESRLPEMHVWALIIDDPKDPVFVDLTAGYFPEQAKKLCGFDWPGDQPPKYLWSKLSEMPPSCCYKSMQEPTLFALKAVAREFDMETARKLIPVR